MTLQCAWCGGPVLPEVCVILKARTDDGQIEELPFHWECIWEAKVEELRKAAE